MARILESTFLSSDGHTQLYCKEYLPDREATGIVQIVHGLGEHVGRYDAFASFLADNGYIVAAHDQLGHGRSAADSNSFGCLSDKDGWDKATKDIRSFHDMISSKYPGKPYFILGHSMGSFLVRTYMIRFRDGLDGVVLSGTGQQKQLLISGEKLLTSLEARRRGARYKSVKMNKLAFGSYNDKFDGVRTSFDWISRDESVVDSFVADPLCSFVPSAGLMRDMMAGIDFISRPKNVSRMKKALPVLFVSGDCDPVGENGRGVIRAYKSFLKAGMTDVTMKLYHGARHEVLNEINKAEVYQDILTWLNGKSGR